MTFSGRSLQISMKLQVCLTFSLFLLTNQTSLHAQTQAEVSLAGYVYDRESGQPLQATNVFISNSMRGAATDSLGRFTIKNAPSGVIELVVSMIGYEIEKRMLKIGDAPPDTLVFRLTPKAIQAPEIVVSAKDRARWRKNLKRFTRLFFSKTENAAACKILNPEVLDFSIVGANALRGKAREPLQIENRALGYKLHYVLEHFEASEDFVIYSGAARFEELAAVTPEETKKWRDNRLRTYLGSTRHFLTALVENFAQTRGALADARPMIDKEPLNEQGFYVLAIKERSFFEMDRRTVKGNLVNTNRMMAPGEFGFERRLSFDNYWQVTYTKEFEEEGYLEFLKEFNRQPSQQISWIRLPQGSLLFNGSGYSHDPAALETHGYWAWQRAADMLPFDYIPPSSQRKANLTISNPGSMTNSQLYQEGLALMDKGNWQETLDLWRGAFKSLKNNDTVDPRIGFSFIELATKHEATDYYEIASELYQRAFSETGWRAHAETVLQEAERVIPLLQEDEAQAWRRLIKKKDSKLVAEISKFWAARDPTPSTTFNERLVQHWERIAYARKEFRKSIKEPYKTDDRGLIYVKYGAPDRQKSLSLGSSVTEMMRWHELARGDSGEIGELTFSEVKSRMDKYLTHPECEVWLYDRLVESESTLFIFGNEEGAGAFRLVDGIEDLMPRSSFRKNDASWVGFPAGAMLQTMYYGELMAFDSYFQSRYNELQSMWTRALNHAYHSGSTAHMTAAFYSTTRAVRIRYKDTDEYNPARLYAPPERSEFADLGQRIRLSAAKVRRLNRQNQPQVVFAAFAVPHRVAKMDASGQPRPYVLNYTLILRDNTMREIERFSGDAIAGLENAAVFAMPDQAEATHFTLAAEAFARDTLEILGAGRAFFSKAPPLDPDPKKLEVSDLVLGILPPENADFSRFPFPILPSQKIWRGDALQVWFEAYHLKPDNNGLHSFSVEMRVTRLEKKKDRIKRKEMISTAFDFESATATAAEFFGVDIGKLKKGEYEMSVEIVDRNSSQRKRRAAKFSVLEK